MLETRVARKKESRNVTEAEGNKTTLKLLNTTKMENSLMKNEEV